MSTEVRYTDPPQSRNEAILKATIEGTEYTDPPQSRIEDLLLELKEAIEEGGGGGGGGVPLADVTDFTVEYLEDGSHDGVNLTWTDPDDIVVSGITLATWAGTIIVKKVGSAPTSRTDGTVLVNSTTRDAYSSNALVDTDVEYGVKYYYRAFPYTTGKTYTTGSVESVVPSKGVCLIPTVGATLIYDGTEQTQIFNNYDSGKMTVSGNTGTDAGAYTATFTLNTGYIWEDETMTPKTVPWNIYGEKLTVPTVTGSFTYDGTEKMANVSSYDPTKIEITGITGTNAGTYTATLHIIDSNCMWTDETTADKTATWSIAKATGSATLTPLLLELDPETLSDTITISEATGEVIGAVSSDTSVATVSLSGNTITVASVNDASGTITITVSIAASANYEAATVTATVKCTFTSIYGVEWDGSSSPAMTRTDDAAGFTDPVPQMKDGSGWTAGSSPFDNLMPWSGMTIVEDANAGTLVRIPKFYYKRTINNSTGAYKLQIADGPAEGFKVSPAHQDRGDGVGERDYIYVGRYHCGATAYKSVTGQNPKASQTRDAFRSAIHNLGSDIWQWDKATLETIQMLYLVEFANWNSQAVIGYGCGNNSGTDAAGSTDGMTYHTGTNQSNRTTYGHTQYRHIEDLWGNVRDWLDGVYFANSKIYAVLNPANFSDTQNGVDTGFTPSLSGKEIKRYAVSAGTGLDWFSWPAEEIDNSNYDTYVCDLGNASSSYVVVNVGGYYNQLQNYGLFFQISNAVTYSNATIGSRLMKLPSA